MYDCIIIGSGPSGLSAAINLKTYNKNFVWFGTKTLSDKIQKAEKIVNYPEVRRPNNRKYGTAKKENGLTIHLMISLLLKIL